MLTTRNYFDNTWPKELFIRIFIHLPPEELLCLSLVNKFLFMLIIQNETKQETLDNQMSNLWAQHFGKYCESSKEDWEQQFKATWPSFTPDESKRNAPYTPYTQKVIIVDGEEYIRFVKNKIIDKQHTPFTFLKENYLPSRATRIEEGKEQFKNQIQALFKSNPSSWTLHDIKRIVEVLQCRQQFFIAFFRCVTIENDMSFLEIIRKDSNSIRKDELLNYAFQLLRESGKYSDYRADEFRQRFIFWFIATGQKNVDLISRSDLGMIHLKIVNNFCGFTGHAMEFALHEDRYDLVGFLLTGNSDVFSLSRTNHGEGLIQLIALVQKMNSPKENEMIKHFINAVAGHDDKVNIILGAMNVSYKKNDTAMIDLLLSHFHTLLSNLNDMHKQQLLAPIEGSKVNPNGTTLLHLACERGALLPVKLLLELQPALISCLRVNKDLSIETPLQIVFSKCYKKPFGLINNKYVESDDLRKQYRDVLNYLIPYSKNDLKDYDKAHAQEVVETFRWTLR